LRFFIGHYLRTGIFLRPTVVGSRFLTDGKLIELDDSRLFIRLQERFFEFGQKGGLLAGIGVPVVGVRPLVAQIQAFQKIIEPDL